MPRQDRLWLHDARDLRERLAPESLADLRQRPAFAVGQVHAALNVRPQDAVLRDKVLIASEELLVDRACDVRFMRTQGICWGVKNEV